MAAFASVGVINHNPHNITLSNEVNYFFYLLPVNNTNIRGMVAAQPELAFRTRRPAAASPKAGPENAAPCARWSLRHSAGWRIAVQSFLLLGMVDLESHEPARYRHWPPSWLLADRKGWVLVLAVCVAVGLTAAALIVGT